MHLSTLISQTLLAATVTASVIGNPKVRQLQAANTTAQPPKVTATPSSTGDALVGVTDTYTCTDWYEAWPGDTCVDICAAYGITFADFLRWNPSVGEDCSRLYAYSWYCMGATLDPAPSGTPATTTATTTSAPAPTDTCNPDAPVPTQPVPVCGCTRWHEVRAGDTCYDIGVRYGVSNQDLYSWNSNLGDFCTLLWVGYFICVGA